MTATTGLDPFEPVHVTIDRCARDTPGAPAISDQHRDLDYADLVTASREFAAELRAHGAGPGTVVAVHLPRGCALAVTLLATARIGAGALLLDRDGPSDWLLSFVETAAPVVAVSDVEQPGWFRGAVVHPFGAPPAGVAVPEPDAEVGEEDLACLVQTSGTTGVPKLVAVPHRTWSYAAATQRVLHRVTPDERGAWLFPAHTNVSASVVIWPFLTAGAHLVVPADELVSDPPALAGWLREQGVTQFFAVAPLAEALARLPWPPSPLWLMLTGSDRVREWGDRDLPFEVGNWYGANEVNIVTSSVLPWEQRVTSATATVADRTGTPPIGRYWPGTRPRVVDPHTGVSVPPGGIGELWVGGRQIAAGYLSPRQTAEKFGPDPDGAPGDRIYRTGDLVRERRDGVLEHCGRIDEQVKINGMRVELGEVEQQLLLCAGVAEAAATTVNDPNGRPRLVAYVVPVGDRLIEEVALRSEAAALLPSHMVPVSFVVLPELPRNRGDKIDRRALTTPRPSPAAAPADNVARRLTEIWSQALEQPTCTADDNFFLLGGDSLQASKAIALVSAEFGTDLEVKDVLMNPTCREFATLLHV